MANIKTISPDLTDGELNKIYENLLEIRGKIAEAHKIQCLNPKALVTFFIKKV